MVDVEWLIYIDHLWDCC